MSNAIRQGISNAILQALLPSPSYQALKHMSAPIMVRSAAPPPPNRDRNSNTQVATAAAATAVAATAAAASIVSCLCLPRCLTLPRIMVAGLHIWQQRERAVVESSHATQRKQLQQDAAREL